jgi:hypothetical protein
LAIADPRVVLLPLELLDPRGVLPEGRRLLIEGGGLAEKDVDLLGEGYRLYRERASLLSKRADEIAPPSTRSIAIVLDPGEVRPFASLLNDAAWVLDRSDVEASSSSPELVAWLLAVADRLRINPDVTLAPVQIAAWWFERSDSEIASFTGAAARSTRPDAEALRACAAAIPDLRRLRHRPMRPPLVSSGHRPIPGTGLLVPRRLEAMPPRLVESLRTGSQAALDDFRGRCARSGDAGAEARGLCAWLEDSAPPLLVLRRGVIAWSPERPGATDDLAHALREAAAIGIRDVRRDLEILAEHSLRFLRSLVDPTGLAPTDPDAEQRGSCFMHRGAAVIAYDLEEPGIERLSSPAIPWGREMLGARCLHEWAHRAVDSGWVPRAVEGDAWQRRFAELASRLDEAIAAARPAVRAEAIESVRGGRPGAVLADLFARRLPDFASNLLAARFWSQVEQEVYVAQNVRPLDGLFPPTATWKKFVRHLYEAQYLLFSDVPDPGERYVAMAGLGPDLERLSIDPPRWTALLEAARSLCLAHEVDRGRIRLPVPRPVESRQDP